MSNATAEIARSLPPYARARLQGLDADRLSAALHAMRRPEELMREDILKRIKASNLSFTRSLVERMFNERWRIMRRHCEVGPDGKGLVIYDINTPFHEMTFAAHCDGLEAVERSGRIKDNKLDFYSALFDYRAGLDRIRQEGREQIGKVWHGRTDNSVLGWSFANRSNRHFDSAIESLVRGEQPDLPYLAASGGYLIRNAGFYGNGRHGCRSWQAFGAGHPLAYPYHVDLFSVYMWRLAGYDFVEEIARWRNPAAPRIDDQIRRYLGVGNQSGIGMVAALVRWPHWLSGFCFARELCLAYALTESAPIAAERLSRLVTLLRRAVRYYRESDRTIDPRQEDRELIANELQSILYLVEELRHFGTVAQRRETRPLQAIMHHARSRMSVGAAEQLASILIDCNSEMTGELAALIPEAMAFRRDVAPEMTVGDVRAEIAEKYGWAMKIDFSQPGARHHFWYRSEENGENRRGERDIDPGTDFETFIDVAGHVQALDARLANYPGDWIAARYLLEHPDDIYILTRIALARDLPYSEIQGNILRRDFLPSDLIQFYLAVLGMETTDPNNFRWVRGVFFQGAPLPEDIIMSRGMDWSLPVLGSEVAGLAPGCHAIEGEEI